MDIRNYTPCRLTMVKGIILILELEECHVGLQPQPKQNLHLRLMAKM